MSICNLDHFAESFWQTKKHVLVGGGFDPLHEGHLQYFIQARQWGPLVCAVTPDAELRQKRTPLLSEMTRLKVMNACSWLEHVHLATTGIPAVIRALKPSHYVVGKDWEGKLPEDTIQACHESGAVIVFEHCRETSSTAILADYERRRNAEKLAAFERFVSTQKPADKPWEPVTDYSFEARKAIEGPHAQIIKDTFGWSHSVLDVGCGPGHLVMMLRDLQMTVRGVDAVERHDWPTHDDYPTLFRQLDITDDCDVFCCEHSSCNGANVVICREVLEHLTVQQIAIAVRNLVKLSSKFCYVTTRFTPDSHLLDFRGADDLDPTHISLTNQDLLRTLFVLEGCTRRADLEAKLDWQQKGRVLVYEVPA